MRLYDPAGDLVHVIDERTIALAERPGNRRADGYRNILENPHVGLLFVIPGRGDTLRINGRARLVSDAPFFDELVVKGHRPVPIHRLTCDRVREVDVVPVLTQVRTEAADLRRALQS